MNNFLFEWTSKSFFILVFFFECLFLSAQQNVSDSLSLSYRIDSLLILSDKNWKADGPFDDNILWIKEAENLAGISRNWEKQVYCLLVLSTVYSYSNDPINHEKTTEKSLHVANKNLDEGHQYYTHIYNRLNDVSRKKKLYKEAIEYSRLGLDQCKGCSFFTKSQLLNKIANSYISLGDYSKAIDYLKYNLSLDYEEKVDDYFQKYYTHHLFALVYKKQKSNAKSLHHLKLAEGYLMHFYKSDYNNELANLWISMIEILLDSGQKEQVGPYLNLIESKNYGKDSLIITSKYKFCLARLQYDNQFSVDSSIIKLADESISILKNAKLPDVSLDLRIGQILEFKGDVYSEQNSFEEAILTYESALSKLGYVYTDYDYSKIQNKAASIRLQKKLMNIYSTKGNSDKVLKSLDAILGMIKYLRIENSTASTKDYWANENQRIFEDLIGFNMTHLSYAKVYELMEENKSNLLIQDINENDFAGFANLSDTLIQKGKVLKSEIAYCNGQIRTITQNENIDSTVLGQLIIQKNKFQLELDKYMSDMEKNYPEYYNMKYNLEPVSLSSIQSKLDKGSVVIEYFIGEEKAYVAYVSSHNLQIEEIENVDSLKSLSLRYYQSISQNGSTTDDSLANQLFSLLKMSELQRQYPNAKDIVVVADDFLNNLPFEVLQDDNGEYLMDTYNIQYQYSARLWNMLRSRKSERKEYDFVGYAYNNQDETFASDRSCFDISPSNLKCAKKEIRSIMEIIDSDNVSSTHDGLSNLLPVASQTKILHLATHACLDEQNSDYSRIYFNDTLLTNQDLKVKDFSADMVVLSACETGFGEIVKGEGSMSLSKGFFHAGAKSTLVSLWPVDDCATSDLMEYFYQNLKEGFTKDQALRNAKIQYRNSVSSDREHPYYWAGFIIIGDCSPIWNTSNNLVLGFLILVGVALLLYLIGRIRK